MPERTSVEIPHNVRMCILATRGENINDFTDRLAESLGYEGWRVTINHPVPELLDGKKATIRIYAEDETENYSSVAICIDKHEVTNYSIDRLLQFPDDVCRVVVLMFAWEINDRLNEDGESVFYQLDAIVPVLFPETESYKRSRSKRQSIENDMGTKERFGRRGAFNKRRQV